MTVLTHRVPYQDIVNADPHPSMAASTLVRDRLNAAGFQLPGEK